MSRQEAKATVEVSMLKGWQPMPGKSWVRDYRWKATLDHSIPGTVGMKSAWEPKRGKSWN